MIDTIVLVSDTIDESIARIIESSSIIKFGIDCSLNETLYTFTSNELRGSYDNRIRIQVKRSKFIHLPESNTVEKVDCDPYLEVEASLHKFHLGHNVYGGSNHLFYQVTNLINFINVIFDIDLPSEEYIYYYPEENFSYFNDFWKVKRIDIAKVYNLGDNLDNFFNGFSHVYYPRRRVLKFDNSGLYFPGSYTTLKMYHKGKEFKKHDRKRLLSIKGIEETNKLQSIADNLLRIELEIKSKKLRDMNKGKLPYLFQVDILELEEQFNVELKRVFKLGENNMKLYNNSKDVEKRLKQLYGSSFNIYYGTWSRLAVFGYDDVKNSMNKATFYRHITKLREAGITWNHTDITKKENNVVEFVFNPFNTDLELKEDLIYKIAN